MKLLNKCIIFASEIFDGQTDRGDTPYILHCLHVMQALQTSGQNIDIILAGLFHDALEQGIIIVDGVKRKVTSQDLLELGCSKKTVRLVEGLTKIEGQTQEEYEANILTDVDLMVIKFEDLQHNINLDRLKKVTEKDLIRNQQYHTFIYKIYSELTKKFGEKKSKHFNKGVS